MKLVSDLNSQIDDCLKKSRFFTDYERILLLPESPNPQAKSINKTENQQEILKNTQENLVKKSLKTDQNEPNLKNLTENDEDHLSLLELDKLLTDRLIQLNPDNKFILSNQTSSPDQQDPPPNYPDQQDPPPNYRNLPHLNTIIEENSIIASEMDTIPKTNSQSVLVMDVESIESFHNTYSNICEKDRNEYIHKEEEMIIIQPNFNNKKNNDSMEEYDDKGFISSDLIRNNSDSFRKASLISFKPNSIDQKSNDEQKSNNNSIDTLDLSTEKEVQCFIQDENEERLILKLNNFLENVIKVETEVLNRRASFKPNKPNNILIDSKKVIPVVKFDIVERRKPNKASYFNNKENNLAGKSSFFKNKIGLFLLLLSLLLIFFFYI